MTTFFLHVFFYLPEHGWEDERCELAELGITASVLPEHYFTNIIPQILQWYYTYSGFNIIIMVLTLLRL